MNRDDWTPERTLLHGQIMCLQSDIKKQGKLDPPFLTAMLSASMAWDVTEATKAALGTLDSLGYTYHGGAHFKPPLGPARRVHAHDMLSVPVLRNFDNPEPVGELRISKGALPMLFNYHFAVGYRQRAEGTGDLVNVAIVPDAMGYRQSQEYVAPEPHPLEGYDADDIREMAERLRHVPGGNGDIIDFLEDLASKVAARAS